MIMDKFDIKDLGLRVVNRNGEEGIVEGIEIRFPNQMVPICYYSNDLYYALIPDTEHPNDIMQVKLASGVILWERPKVIVRRFSEHIYLYNRIIKQIPPEFEALDGKLVSFVIPGGKTESYLHQFSLGSCGGIEVQYWDTVPVLNIFGNRG